MQSARTLRIRAQVLARSWSLWVVAVSMSLVSMSPALARAQDKQVAVLSFEGQRSAKLREAVVSSVSEEVSVVPNKEVQAKASELGVDLDSSDGRVAVARELEIDAFVQGRVDKAGRNWTLVLSVASGSSGEFAEVAELTAKDPKKLVARAESRSFSELSAAIARSERPAKAEPEPEPVAEKEEEPEPEPEAEEEPQPEDEEEAAQDDRDSDELPMALALELGAGGFSRDFEYRENIDSLPVYDIAAPPIAFVGLEWFPAAHFTGGAAAHVGLRARGQLAFGLSSGLESGPNEEFDTTSTLIEVGLRGRLPLDDLQLGADISYGSHTYKIDSIDTAAGLLDPGIPSASYSYVRLHIDASLALGDSASIGLGFGLLPMLGLGEIEEWFPQASGLAMEGDIHFAYELFSSFDLIASIGARRYAVTLEPTVDDVNNNRPIAAGLVDQYIAGQLGLRIRLGGTP